MPTYLFRCKGIPWYEWRDISKGSGKLSNHFGGGSHGLVVMGDDSYSKGCGFKSQHHILDGHFLHLFVVKIVLFVSKDRKSTKKKPGIAIF